MSRLLYGSSNVYRNYSRSLFPKSGFTLVECTRKVVFDAHIASLGKLDVNSLIVTSVLENFVSDACRDLAADQAEFFARQQVTVHVDALSDLVRENPTTTVFISPLLARNVPGKFDLLLVVIV
jgi:hypothetical protein